MKKLLVLPLLFVCKMCAFDQYYRDNLSSRPSAPDQQPGYQTEGHPVVVLQQKPPLPPRNSISVKAIREEARSAARDNFIKHLTESFDHIIATESENLRVMPWTKRKIANKINSIKKLNLSRLALIYNEKILSGATIEDLLQDQEKFFRECVQKLISDVVEKSKCCFPYC